MEIEDLDKDDKELTDCVFDAYEKAEGGTLRAWARHSIVKDGIQFEEWDVQFIKAMEATMLSVICKMIKEGIFLKRIKEVKP